MPVVKRPRTDKLPSGTALIGALLALLILLATLQYYWLGEISAGERERMQSLVRSGAARFGEDFDLEIAGIFLGLQMPADTVLAQRWASYAQRYESWRSRSAHPRLVGDIYMVQLYENGRMTLLRFKPDTPSVSTAAWPDSIASLRQRLAQSLKTVRIEGGMLVGDTPEPCGIPASAARPTISRTSSSRSTAATTQLWRRSTAAAWA